jgi:hypothetical protein
MGLFFIAILCFTLLSNILDYHQPKQQEILREIFKQGVLQSRLTALFKPQLFQKAIITATGNTLLLFLIFWLAGGELRLIDNANNYFLNCNERFFLLLIFCLSTIASASLAYFGSRGFPMSGDGYAYLTQAKILAQGKLYVNSHPLRQFFHCDFMVNNGKYFACYPLGTPFFILLGELLGLPWLANPVAGSLALIVIYYMLKEFFSPETARYGVCFILLGHFFNDMNSTYLSHPVSLLFISLFIYLFLTSVKQIRSYRSLLAGLALGGAVFARPLTAAAISTPILLWGLYKLIREKKPFSLLYMFASGISAPLLVLMWINKIQTGNPFVLGYQLQFRSPGFQEGYNLLQAIGTMLWRFRAIEYMVKFEPLSIFIPLFFIIFGFRGKNKYPYLFLGLLGVLCVAYLPLSTSIWDLRYYYPPLMYLIGLLPWGIYNFSDYANKRGLRFNHRHVLSLLLGFIFCFKVWGIYQWGFKPYNTLEKLQQPYTTIARAKIKNAIVFLRNIEGELYPQWYTRNSLDYSDAVLYALDLGEENKLLMDYYPKRNYYIYSKGELTQIYP